MSCTTARAATGVWINGAGRLSSSCGRWLPASLTNCFFTTRGTTRPTKNNRKRGYTSRYSRMKCPRAISISSPASRRTTAGGFRRTTRPLIRRPTTPCSFASPWTITPEAISSRRFQDLISRPGWKPCWTLRTATSKDSVWTCRPTMPGIRAASPHTRYPDWRGTIMPLRGKLRGTTPPSISACRLLTAWPNCC